ncbi:MAG: chloride channel protein [Methanoculleaceae archaeon]
MIDQYLTTYWRRVIFLAIVMGLVSGGGALAFFEGLKFGTEFFMGDLLGIQLPAEGEGFAELAGWVPPPPERIWFIPPLLCLGALISGLVVYTFAPEAEGHGTDAAIRAFHEEGVIRWRVPPLKAVASIFTISTGGSAGREGPTAQISAGLGSVIAGIFGFSTRERRLAIATGLGAGIGTIFMAPLGGAILAAELLYKEDFESSAIIPAFLASVIGYSIFGMVEGFEPVFATASTSWNVGQIPLFLVLGVIAATVGIVYIRTFYWTQQVFNSIFSRYNLPVQFKPLAGAVIIGIIILVITTVFPDGVTLALASLGTGYGFAQLGLYNLLPLSVLLALPFIKILTTALTIGSGGSGGVFAPGLIIGGSTGGAVGALLHIMLPSVVPAESVPVFIIVGMIALFGSISHSPIAVLIMVVEMTGDYSLLVPSMGAVAVAAICVRRETIYREQVDTRADSPAHRGEYMIEILSEISVRDAMIPRERVITLSPADPVKLVVQLANETGHTGYPVLEDNRIVGVITLRDVREAGGNPRVSDLMSRRVISITPEKTLEDALRIMMMRHINHLPVVATGGGAVLEGFLTRTDIMQAYVGSISSR